VENFVYTEVGSEKAWKGGHCSNPCTSTVSDLLCNPLLKHSADPHFEQSAVPS
jgi:hypothetical protein